MEPEISLLIELAKRQNQKNTIEVYSIQLYSSEFPEKISNIKSRYTNLFSEEFIEEVFEPPYFKAITGAYLDKKMAEKRLSVIKKYFKSAFVLKREIPIISFMEYIMSNPRRIAD
tara:strand:- start:945 stop:1289 length:345 start_codon:yes stop_codon:yes gene_type:complete